MGILVCERCNTYYEIHSKGELVELGTCECGTKLKYFESLEDYYDDMESDSANEDDFFSYLISSHESAIARIILFSISELPFPLDKMELIGYLNGTKSSVIINHNLSKLNSYSCLSYFSKKRLTRYIDILKKWGLIETRFKPKVEKEIIIITDNGDEFLKNEDNLPFKIYAKKSLDFMKNVDRNLYDILRKLRKEIAIHESIKAYIVCNNESLIQMAKKNPQIIIL